MVEQAPHRSHEQSAKRNFIRLASKLLAAGFVMFNWLATQYAAAALWYSPSLSGRLVAHAYQPFGWYWWHHRWPDGALRLGNRILFLATLWRFCEHLVIYPTLALGGIVGVCALFLMDHGKAADLHGSATWATEREIREANLL